MWETQIQAYTGGENWTDECIVTAVKRFIYNGGGFIGVGEPAGHQYQGAFPPACHSHGSRERNRLYTECG